MKSEEISKIFDFFMRNQNDSDRYAFSIDEIIRYTGIENLTHEKLTEIKEIVFSDYEKNGINKWYRYESIKKQFQKVLNQLVKDGLLKEEIKDGESLKTAYNDDYIHFEGIIMNKENIDKKMDNIIELLKSIKELKDIELGKQNEKLTKFENVEELLKSIKAQNDNIKELNVNIKELIRQNGDIKNRLTSIANSNLGNLIIIFGILMSVNYSLISTIIKNYSTIIKNYGKQNKLE